MNKYLVMIGELNSNFATFENRFTAFDLIRELYKHNPELKIWMFSTETGFAHNIEFLKQKEEEQE